ncbi:hypothetical protein BAU15_03085 [Enterococcus sp. JM4C]|uniref:hypothetical protein n=1 Tax=Candidatus Enterococcus huntleyi TaxID=1857217 RepID=UPI001379BE90|nr:hypothetical protein [Enterococcus sp. JM4C]KAF1295543.1 hypothetical protein BAU15_03085 [Enterococcus sp. JM4C]
MKRTGNFLVDTSIELVSMTGVYLFLNSVWISYGLILLSPLLVVAASLLGLQVFLWINFFLACSFVALAVFLTPWLLRFTRKTLLLMGESLHNMFKVYALRRCVC